MSFILLIICYSCIAGIESGEPRHTKSHIEQFIDVILILPRTL